MTSIIEGFRNMSSRDDVTWLYRLCTRFGDMSAGSILWPVVKARAGVAGFFVPVTDRLCERKILRAG